MKLRSLIIVVFDIGDMLNTVEFIFVATLVKDIGSLLDMFGF